MGGEKEIKANLSQSLVEVEAELGKIILSGTDYIFTFTKGTYIRSKILLATGKLNKPYG